MSLTQLDYDAYTTGRVTIPQLCYSNNMSPSTVHRHLNKYKGGKPLLNADDKAQLREELIQATPYDAHYGTQAILARYRVKTITQALQLLKVKTMAELRHGSELTLLLKQHKLKYIKGVLYAPGNRGAYKEDRQIRVDNLTTEWIKENVDLIYSVCYKKDTKPTKTTKALSLHLIRRFNTAKNTRELLNRHCTTREITKKLGTGKYVTALRAGELEDLFTDEELEMLTKGGMI